YGKSRFSSQVAPERRLLLQLLGLMLALRKRQTGGKTPALREWATDKLQMLKFSVVAAAAAVCDGEELVLEFTRSVEAENTDPCTLASLVDEFLKTMETLFVEGNIWRADNKHTWTQVVIDQMKEAKKDFLPKGLQEELRECHARVAAWAKTIRDGIQSEFPSQEIMLQMEGLSLAQWNALNGFGKTCADKAAKTDRTVDLERRFRKVAKVVHVSEDEAFKQFLELKDCLLYTWRKLGDNIAAWRSVLERCRVARRKRPVDALLLSWTD
ncbi:unnamed protein product, partial [Symbiodinium sp. CCMP2456]